MNQSREFWPLEAEEIAEAFNEQGVAPDGLPDFSAAKKRGVLVGIYRIANLRDIIASKRAAARQRDKLDLPLLESFRVEYEKQNPSLLRSASEIAKSSKESQA